MSDQDMKASIREINNQLKSIDGRLDKQGETLIRQEESIKHHIYRTDLAEEAIDLLRKDMAPIKKHVLMIEGVLKFVGALSVLAGIAAGVFQILQFFK